jgi:hypothetical protein
MCPVKTLIEVKKAVTELSPREQTPLAHWLNSQLAPVTMSAAEERRLLASLDEAMRDLDAGKGVPLEAVRKLIPTWASQSSSRRKR